MKIGIITDIHNNIVALDAVLKAFEDTCCDRVICCGDIIGIGPRPEETVSRLMSVPNLTCVRGNHESYLLDGIPGPDKMPETEARHHEWEHDQLSPHSKAFLAALPSEAELTVNGIKIYAAHYALDSQSRFAPLSPRPTLWDCQRMFHYVDADIILFGHDHAACLFQTGKTKYCNCGSLGCPMRDKSIARAGILIISGRNTRFEPLHISYDTDQVLADIDRLHYPAAEEIKKIFFGM